MLGREFIIAVLVAGVAGSGAVQLISTAVTTTGHWWRARLVADWQPTSCLIEEHWVEVPAHGPAIRHLRYTYRWQNTTRTGTRFALADDPANGTEILGSAQAFPSETKTTCVVDPENPTASVLQPPPPMAGSEAFVAVLLGLGAGVPLALLSLLSIAAAGQALVRTSPSGDGVPTLALTPARWTAVPRLGRRGRLRAQDGGGLWAFISTWCVGLCRGRILPERVHLTADLPALRPGALCTFHWRTQGLDAVEIHLVGREEALSPGCATPTIHTFFVHNCSTNLVGSAEVACPIAVPPTWSGQSHQISWAIEVHALSARGPWTRRFPLPMQAPRCLQVASAQCPAEAAVADLASIRLLEPISEIRPGGSVAGLATWRLPTAPQKIGLQLRVCCRGRAGIEEHTLAACELARPPAVSSSRFELRLPGSPLSWHGELFECNWRIVAVADGQPFAALDLTVIPVASPTAATTTAAAATAATAAGT